jgi:hypothetical protein
MAPFFHFETCPTWEEILSDNATGFADTVLNMFNKTLTEALSAIPVSNRVAQTALILFSTFLDLRPVSDASD